MNADFLEYQKFKDEFSSTSTGFQGPLSMSPLAFAWGFRRWALRSLHRYAGIQNGGRGLRALGTGGARWVSGVRPELLRHRGS